MSKEDDAIIQAASKRLYDHVTIGGDPFGVALADTMYVEDMAVSSQHAANIVRQMCDKAAAEVIRAYLDGLEKAGWKVVPKTWNEPMWKAWQESAGGGEIEFRHVIAASPTPPGAEP